MGLVSNIYEVFRVWKIKRYKQRKIKDAGRGPVKHYRLFFRLEIKDHRGIKSADRIFDIIIPASGFFFAKKQLESFVFNNLNIEVVEIETLEKTDHGNDRI